MTVCTMTTVINESKGGAKLFMNIIGGKGAIPDVNNYYYYYYIYREREIIIYMTRYMYHIYM